MTKVQTIPRNGLVGEWLLDWNALDTSGSGNNGTATNVTYTNTDRGYQSQAWVFNGSNSTIISTAPDFFWTQPLSVSLIIRISVLPTWWNLWIISGFVENTIDSWTYDKAFEINSSWQIFFKVYDWAIKTASFSWLAINTYYHLVWTYDWTNLKISVNWVEWTSTTASWTFNFTNPKFWFSGSFWGANVRFNWNIQSTRIYNRALSTQEIQSLYMEGLRKLWGSGLAPLTDGLVAYYDFNWDANDIVWGNNGTVTGATLTSDRFGNANRAYSFNGTSDFISNSTALWTPWVFTMHCWFKPLTTPGLGVYKYVMFATNWATTWFTIIYANPSGTVQVIGGKEASGSAFSNARSNTTLTNGTWYHLVATSDGTTDTIYIDWVNSWSAATVGSGGISRTAWTYFWKCSDGNFSDGDIWEGQVIKRCLSASEVKALYQLSSQRYITPYL